MRYFLLLLFFLGLSLLLRKRIPILERYRIPPSLLAGVFLLVYFTLADAKMSSFYLHLKSLPAEFIALVFACFFLQRPQEKKLAERRLPQILGETSLIWVSVMGQVLVGLVATLLIYKPFFDLPLSFASVLETGFAGGHGTAVAMGPILAQNGLAAGFEYGLFSATVGLVCGIVGGVWLIHREHRKTRIFKEKDDNLRVSWDLPTLLKTLTLIAAAYWVGVFYKGIVEHEILPRVAAAFLPPNFSLPLFAYTLIGGLTVRQILVWSRSSHLIENDSILLSADVFLEVVIAAGIAIIDVTLLGSALIPLLSLFALGFAWNLFCHHVIRPRILTHSYSFELGLINFGMLNGTAATGFMLLKMVDPKFETQAARTFAEASALTQPFIAGGILTLATPFILMSTTPWVSVTLFAGLFSVWLTVGLTIGRRHRAKQ